MPLPDSVTGRGLEGADGWAVLESVGREVFTVMRGDAGADYAELFEEFREDPQSVLRSALKPAVASGITVSSALPYILPVTAWLLKVAGERVAVQAVDALSDATREKITRLLGRRRTAAAADETTGEAGTATLDAGEEQAALTALAAWAESVGADAAEAREVAEAIIKVLRNGGRAR
ncbi:hypothetical protein [Streptomyces avermitilis]|uniref:Uncharacterized protein n=2 Tax=Streptomyces avermitilis TaxID=33903 RepID=A0A4D4M7Q4_STRAX|nr:hypothetical protein [Streptomyces avermitilis]BBJ56058.1 hypothetical protein SAVMC3_86870 [Streptomyces avermitilis]GDY68001.1 hypothetical protein SAV14893_073940 [Streptomyces avermitilis]